MPAQIHPLCRLTREQPVRRWIELALLIACTCSVAGCSGDQAPVEETPPEKPAVQLANPASQHCAEQGGKHITETGPGGGQYSVCLFEDNRQCEEWALLRGECPPGGIKVTGYATAAARYCAVTGGSYAVVARSGAADEQGTCTLPGGKTCDADEYYALACTR